MIERLTIRNFQRHRRRTIKFHKRCTTFVGSTDSGKSTALRALQWVAFNQPAGSEYRRWGTKRTKVILTIDGHKITRARSGSQNVYTLDRKKFVAFKSDVPPEIAKLLNVSPENFQGQFDGVFWLSDSAGAAAKRLNAVINLGQIDSALATVASMIRKESITADVAKQRLQDARKAADAVAWYPEFTGRLKLLKRTRKEARQTHYAARRMARAIRDVKTAIQTVRTAQPAAEAGQKLLEIVATAHTTAERADRLTELIAEIESQTRVVDDLRAQTDAAKKKFHKHTKGKSCPICGKTL